MERRAEPLDVMSSLYRDRNENSTGELSQKFTKPRINGPKAVFAIVGKII